MSAGPIATLRFCERTNQLEVYERWFAIVWRVEGYEDDWLADNGDWKKDKSERALYASREEAREDMPATRVGMGFGYASGTIKLVRVYRRVT